MVGLSTKPTIWTPDQYIRKQDGRYSNSWAVQYQNGIQIVAHLASNLFSIIQIPNYFGIQIPSELEQYPASQNPNKNCTKRPLSEW